MRPTRWALSALLVLTLLGLNGCRSDTPQPVVTSAAATPAATEPPAAQQYFTGGERFTKAWHDFYWAQHEPEIDDSLIAAGGPMVPAICEAVAHPDMQMRRYAIGALGYIGDDRATPTLLAILGDETEQSYFRGDALHSLYLIDEATGVSLAERYRTAGDTLGKYAKAILAREPWLEAPTEE